LDGLGVSGASGDSGDTGAFGFSGDSGASGETGGGFGGSGTCGGCGGSGVVIKLKGRHKISCFAGLADRSGAARTIAAKANAPAKIDQKCREFIAPVSERRSGLSMGP
jgi:hypothetical protein